MYIYYKHLLKYCGMSITKNIMISEEYQTNRIIISEEFQRKRVKRLNAI